MAWSNHRAEALYPIVVLSQQQIKDLYDVVCEFVESSESKDSLKGRVSISVKTENRDEFTLDGIDDIFTMPNRRESLISGLSITGIGSNGHLVFLGFNNNFGWEVGAIRVDGRPDRVDRLISRTRDVIGNDKPLKYFFGATRPLFLSLVIVAYLHMIVGLPLAFINELKGEEIPDILNASIGYLSLLYAIPAFVVLLIIERIQNRFIRKFVANWGDGAIKFEKAISIVNYCLWVVPVTITLRILGEFL